LKNLGPAGQRPTGQRPGGQILHKLGYFEKFEKFEKF
jgi:hypothetical protein